MGQFAVVPPAVPQGNTAADIEKQKNIEVKNIVHLKFISNPNIISSLCSVTINSDIGKKCLGLNYFCNNLHTSV